ncbi:MAG: hypothetical protein ACE5KT_03445 [Methanosarcinales archaeon]
MSNKDFKKFYIGACAFIAIIFIYLFIVDVFRTAFLILVILILIILLLFPNIRKILSKTLDDII